VVILTKNEMKVLPFKVPKTLDESFQIQVENIPYFYNSLHSHPEIQITYIIESKGTLVTGDYIGNFAPNRLYIIGSEQPHVFKNDPEYFEGNEDLKAQSISIFIRKEMFGAQFMQLPEVSRLREFFNLSDRSMIYGPSINEFIFDLMQNIVHQEWLEKLIALLKILQSLAGSKDFRFLSSAIMPKGYNEEEGKRLNDIYQFSLREFHRAITLEEISAVANMTTNSFCRYFKNHTRKSYTVFLNELRVGSACKHLHNKELELSDICYISGFSNISNFNRQFKRITGKTPNEFRNGIASVSV
jgi:AraC-like DNA-binding protein